MEIESTNTSCGKNTHPERTKIKSTAKGTITMGAMAILIITSILSLRGLPSEAKFGVQSIFYYIFAAAVFLLPFSLVCA